MKAKTCKICGKNGLLYSNIELSMMDSLPSDVGLMMWKMPPGPDGLIQFWVFCKSCRKVAVHHPPTILGGLAGLLAGGDPRGKIIGTLEAKDCFELLPILKELCE